MTEAEGRFEVRIIVAIVRRESAHIAPAFEDGEEVAGVSVRAFLRRACDDMRVVHEPVVFVERVEGDAVSRFKGFGFGFQVDGFDAFHFQVPF